MTLPLALKPRETLIVVEELLLDVGHVVDERVEGDLDGFHPSTQRAEPIVRALREASKTPHGHLRSRPRGTDSWGSHTSPRVGDWD